MPSSSNPSALRSVLSATFVVCPIVLIALTSQQSGKGYSAILITHWLMCVIHMVICGAIFLWVKLATETERDWRRAVYRIVHMTLLLFVYCVPASQFFSSVYAIPCEGWRADERAIKEITGLVIVLSVPAWWLLTIIAALLPDLYSALKSVRFHLGTLLVATVIAGALLGANLHPVFVRFPSAPTFCYGWPFTFYFWENGITSFQTRPFVCDLLLWALLLSLSVWRCERWYRKPLLKPARENVVQAP